ncbi:MAG: amidase [Sphingomonas sp.]|uniref:amidase n=1 Tax=Sphingomonas sp. TaxID=28214 RepID=UPI0025E77961|nr:amidase [Sphingomonas sp.]MBX9883229.1 amidase [Sphingomonas sp.]
MKAIALAALLIAAPAAAQQVEEVSIDALRAQLAKGASSEAITRAYLARIAAMDRKGPSLRAVIATNPQAIAQAQAADARRKAGKSLGPLDGIPLLIKDNIETADPLPTTAGSLALKDNLTNRDAPVVARLRAAGAVILGKTNLSEWANIRSTNSISGWSAVGGQVRNPYALDRSACGSSSGSGAAVAASFAAAALGTETDGSVVCPSAMNGLVGLKPTLGLVSRTHVVPISHSQDTPGPMARSVKDAALLFSAMVGSDPADAATKDADAHRADYAAGLAAASLRGVTVAVYRPEGLAGPLKERFDAALGVLKAQGATLVEVERPKLDGLGEAEFSVLKSELKADLNAYLATTPAAVKTRTLADVIAFDKAQAAAEMPFFNQEIFDQAEATPGLDDEYRGARAKSARLAREGLDTMLAKAGATILVTPTYGPAWPIDPIYGDQYSGPSASELPAVSGYPHLTVPMGLARGLPVGLSFIGKPYSEAALLGAGHVYEQAAKARVAPRYLPSADVGPGLEGAR